MRISNQYTHTLRQMHTDRNSHARGNKHGQMNLSSQLWVLFLMIFISMSPNSCSGSYANEHLQSRIYPYRKPFSTKTRSNLLGTQAHFFATNSLIHTHVHTQPPTQHSCRDPERSSKAPLTHASMMLSRATLPLLDFAALTVHTDQSGSLTYQG